MEKKRLTALLLVAVLALIPTGIVMAISLQEPIGFWKFIIICISCYIVVILACCGWVIVRWWRLSVVTKKNLAILNYGVAVGLCDRYIARYPNYAAGYNLRGAVEMRKGEYDAAIADFDAAIRLGPK